MPDYDPLDSENDPFRPPAISTVVSSLHCGMEYDSYRIEWRIERDTQGREHGFWCCPIPDCDGKGFGFDIFPVDPEYQDERGGWVYDDEEGEEDEREAELPDGKQGPRSPNGDEDEAIPW